MSNSTKEFGSKEFKSKEFGGKEFEGISMEHLTKIEGHASLKINFDKGVVNSELQVIEGSRLFEGMLKGRQCFEAPEIVSRICGICSTSHVVASVQAVENALGLKPSKMDILLRKLLLIAEHIRSHATHLYLLALPDYLNIESALEMPDAKKGLLLQGINLINIGNKIIELIAGREIHPLLGFKNIGFEMLKVSTFEELLRILKQALLPALKTVTLFSSFKSISLEKNIEWFSLVDKDYAILGNRLSSAYKTYKPSDYNRYLKEYHLPYSTANHVLKEGKIYFVGALARMNNNHRRLSSSASNALKNTNLKLPSTNAYDNNISQSVELVERVHQAMKLCSKIKELLRNKSARIKIKEVTDHYMSLIDNPSSGRGVAAVEAPRGVLWHEYELDNTGEIVFANIVTPTAQNLNAIELDITNLVRNMIRSKASKEKIVVEIEKLIRAYDPCFSCSTHFLEVDWV